MKCPLCSNDSRVLHTDGQLERRRECTGCRHRWTTLEVDKDEHRRLQEIVTEARALAEKLAA